MDTIHIVPSVEAISERYLETSVNLPLQPNLRLLMTAGQTFSQQGQRRQEFYDGVLSIANNVRFFYIIAIDAISSDHTLSALVTPATFHSSSKAYASIPRTLFQPCSWR